jgi:membrane-associated protease RseP (regulator of RpoE activity)
MKKLWIHIVLLIATILSTLFVGAGQKHSIETLLADPLKIFNGWPFSISLMFILICHETAHYLATKKHNVAATLPYFIPAPTIIGTFGAFIKIKSPITTRHALVDIGASGPIAGFTASVIVTVIGLQLSEINAIQNVAGSLMFGDSIIFKFLSYITFGSIPESYDIFLHPVAFAGWIGFFITALNLIPIGQLDGGHIAYAVFGNKHSLLSKFLLAGLLFLGLIWNGWIMWGALLLILGFQHPPILYWEPDMDKRHKVISWAAAIIFIITFTPIPISVIQ